MSAAIHKLLIRFSDVMLSGLGILLFFLPAIFISVFIRLDSRGPVIFRQSRVGKDDKDFRLLKFRTMQLNSENMGLITVGMRDPRITRMGSFLRRSKLDEVPQLWNVLRGEMSLVGPRPEVRKYVNHYTEEQKIVLSVRPGITDFASIKFSNENELLSKSEDPDQYYINVLIPEKIRLNMQFIKNPGFGNYLNIIWLTIRKVLF